MGSDTPVRGVACHEEAVGWLQVRDRAGNLLAEPNRNVHKCGEAIAMTDVADFTSCTMVRRVDAGEALELIPSEAPAAPAEGGERRKYRACRDGREGWITTKGSQGTVYVRPAPRHYTCAQATPMHSGLGAESAVVRVLMPGEAFCAFEEPREVSGGECLSLYRARAAGGGAEGWVTVTPAGEVRPWSSGFTVVHAVPLTSALCMNEAVEPFEVHRLLEPGEMVDVAEMPVVDQATGLLRARCTAAADQASGWATLRESDVLQLRPATAEEAARAAVLAGQRDAAPATPPLNAPSTPPGGACKGRRPPWEVKEEPDDSKGFHGKGSKGKPWKGKGKGQFKR